MEIKSVSNCTQGRFQRQREEGVIFPVPSGCFCWHTVERNAILLETDFPSPFSSCLGCEKSLQRRQWYKGLFGYDFLVTDWQLWSV